MKIMPRERAKALHKKVMKMSVNKLMDFIASTVTEYHNERMKEAVKVLHDEFGFGPKRQQRFIDRLNEVK